MVEVADLTMGAPVPVLRSLDETRAREFYIDYLHFTIEWEHRFEYAQSVLYMRLLHAFAPRPVRARPL